MSDALGHMRLALVSHVVHYRWEGKLYAYAAYAREIEVWAGLFSEILVAAPFRREPPPGDCVAFVHTNISVRPQMEAGGNSWRAKVGLVFSLPMMAFQLCMAFRGADAIHVRCPGNLGLLGTLLAPLFSRNVIAKYAGQWTDYPGEAGTTRWQKHLLRSQWFHGPVTVYGRWPGQPDHIVPFFTSVLTADQIARARMVAGRIRAARPLEIMFVGRLSKAKNVDVLLQAIAKVRDSNAQVRCTVIGEGPERAALEAQRAGLDLVGCIEFKGGLDFEDVLGHFERSDVLVLASETEGWPKAITEAMAYGLICVGSDRGLVPQILSEGRGVIVAPRDVEALAAAIENIASEPGEYAAMRSAAAAWAQQYSLEGLRDALRALLTERWRLPVKNAAAVTMRS
jgi:glycosyltransferase involved in cell wall biosynthesis